MIITLKFSSAEYFNAHKIARAIKDATGQKYKTVAYNRDSEITFDYFFCDSKTPELLVPGVIEQLQMKNNGS